MKKLAGIISTVIFGLGISTGYTQDHSQHQGTTDHGQHHAGAADDHMAHLDADLEEIRKTTDTAKRKQMLQHHLQMMRENIQAITAMDHGGKGEGGAGMQGMDHSGKGEGGAGMQGMDHGGKGEGGAGMQGMDHGGKGEGGAGMQGMDHGGMMQHHDKMVKVLQHMLETQELILGLIDK